MNGNGHMMVTRHSFFIFSAKQKTHKKTSLSVTLRNK